MKDLIKAFGIVAFMSGSFLYVLFNGYPEPLGLWLGIASGAAAALIAVKEIVVCQH